MEFRELINKSVETFTFNSTDQYKDYIFSIVSKYVDGKAVNEKAYKRWFKGILPKLSEASKPGSRFLKEFQNAVACGTFVEISANPQDLDDKAAQLEELESFEKEVDAWIRMFEDVNDKLYVGAPLSRGIDKYNNVRGVFDGLGSFVYTDGTISKKYPKLEDLSKEDRDALIVRIDVHHRGLPRHDDIVALVKGV